MMCTTLQWQGKNRHSFLAAQCLNGLKCSFPMFFEKINCPCIVLTSKRNHPMLFYVHLDCNGAIGYLHLVLGWEVVAAVHEHVAATSTGAIAKISCVK